MFEWTILRLYALITLVQKKQSKKTMNDELIQEIADENNWQVESFTPLEIRMQDDRLVTDVAAHLLIKSAKAKHTKKKQKIIR